MIGPVARDGDAPALSGAVALVAGILAGSRAVRGTAEAAAAGALALVWLARVAGSPERRRARVAAVAVLFFDAGFVTGRERIFRPSRAADELFARTPHGDAATLVGTLSDFWSGSPPQARGRLAAERWEDERGARPFPAEVALYVGGRASLGSAGDRGDRVVVTGHLRREDLPASEREIALPWTRYRLSVKSARMIARRERTLGSLIRAPNALAFASIPRRDRAFDRDVRGPLAALLLGRTAELDRGMIARYRRGGLYHLLVVSGLHVALAAGLVAAGLRLSGVRGKARDAALLAAVAGIVLVGGANPPAVRAGLVFGVFLSARLLELPIRGGQAAGLSALVLFLAAPREAFSVGCILTFAAVAGIALFSAPVRARLPERPDWLFSGLSTAVAAEVATAPVLLWRFNLLADGAWLTAPLSIPLSGALIGLGGVLLLFFAAGVYPAPAVALFAAGSRLLEATADRAAGAAWLRPTPPLSGILAVGALLFGAAALPRRARPWSAAAAGALFLALALLSGATGPARGFSLEALDVGQGDSLLLRWGSRALLVDGGGPFDLDARDFGRTRLLPKLLDRGVTRLDAVLATHPHPDHVLGLFAVVEELPVGRVWRSAGEDEGGLYAALDAAARRRGVPSGPLETGVLALPDGARLEVLHSGGLRRKRDPVNDQSVVAVFARDGRRALLTGDAGAATEDELRRGGALGPVDLLKVGHHGSRGSTTPPFLDALCPRLAVVSCGRENRFGHPARETLASLAARGVRVFRTDLSSDVRVELLPEATRLRWRGTAP